MKFIGSKKTVGDIAREAFYNEICALRDEVSGLSYYDGQSFLGKYPYVALMENREEFQESIKEET